MTPHGEWFYEYEKYNGNLYLGDESPKKIIGNGRVKFLLNDGRIKTLLGVLHIPYLAKNLISINKMSNVGVQMEFENDK